MLPTQFNIRNKIDVEKSVVSFPSMLWVKKLAAKPSIEVTTPRSTGIRKSEFIAPKPCDPKVKTLGEPTRNETIGL